METRTLNGLTLERIGRVGKIVKILPEKDSDIIFYQADFQGYEVKRVPYFIILPFSWAITVWTFFKKRLLGVNCKTNSFWVDGISPVVREIKEKAGSWRALNIIYNCRFAKGNKAIDNYWLGIINAQAVRNRFKLVKRELKKIITELADKGEEIKLLSIASGSAQTVFEAFKEIIEERNRSLIFKIILLDIDDTALEYARRLAKEHGIEQNVEFINRSTTDLEKASNGIRPNLIEMVGFLDYRPHEKAARLIKRIYNLLPPGGKFITANICPNREQYFMKWVIDWPMIYREPQELRKLVAECGFEKCKIICEPQKVHAVAICQKPC